MCYLMLIISLRGEQGRNHASIQLLRVYATDAFRNVSKGVRGRSGIKSPAQGKLRAHCPVYPQPASPHE